jgi:hypothetical protein
MEDEMLDFLRSGDGARAVEHINDQLKSAVVDGNLEILPVLYMQRAVWRLHLGLPGNAEVDLLAAQRCALADEARMQVQLLLVQCYRLLDRPEDERKAVDALSSGVQACSVSSPVLMQQLLTCLHSKAPGTNGKALSDHVPATSRSTDREGSKPQPERKKGGMMSGFLSAPSPSTAHKKKSSAVVVETKSAPAAPAAESQLVASNSQSTETTVSEVTPARSKATRTSVYGKTTIEEQLDDGNIDDEEVPSKATWVPPGNSATPSHVSMSRLDKVLSKKPKFLSGMTHEEQNRLAEVMGAAGAG